MAWREANKVKGSLFIMGSALLVFFFLNQLMVIGYVIICGVGITMFMKNRHTVIYPVRIVMKQIQLEV